jgi:glycosyltransferase involved in cell wall biosynthesis
MDQRAQELHLGALRYLILKRQRRPRPLTTPPSRPDRRGSARSRLSDGPGTLKSMQSEQVAAPRSLNADPRIGALRRIAIVPALNEERSIGEVIAEIRAADPELDVIVIDDGSTDRTSAVAAQTGANVIRLPFNVGIGGAVQTGYLYARDHGFDLAVQVDGDGQHDPREISRLLEPILDGRADMVVGTRFAEGGGYRGTRLRRIGIHLFARLVSLIVRARVTDTTSGFRAVDRKAISLFAADYPHDYPEVEATVLIARHRLKMVEVPVQMRVRETGNSSITAFQSVYYMVKVLLALFIGLFRRYSTPLEEK